MRHHQHASAPAGGTPLRGVQRRTQRAAHLAQRAGAAGAGEVELRQVPVATGGIERALAGGVQGNALALLAQGAFGQRGHGGLGADHEGLVFTGLGGRQAGTRQRQGHGRQRQHGHALFGTMAGEHHVGLFGRAQGTQLGLAAGRGAGRKFGHHAGHAAACGLQCLQVFAQPGAVAHGHPHRLASLRAALCAGLQRKVQLAGIVQHAVFEQAFEHRAQPGRLLAGTQRHTGRNGHALPRQRPCGHYSHDLAAGAGGLGQQGSGCGGVLEGGMAVCRERVGVLGGGSRACRRQEKDQGAHGRVLRAILGGGRDTAAVWVVRR